MRQSLGITFPSFILFAFMLGGRIAGAAEPTTAECLAASELSLTFRDQSKLLDARAQLLVCSAASCPTDIREECARRVAQVNASIPTVVFELKDAAGADLQGVKVRVDDQAASDWLDGTALWMDPGEHTFTFEVQGRSPVQKQLVLREGEKHRQEKIVFAAVVAELPLAAPKSDAGPIVDKVPSTEAPSSSSTSRALGTQRLLAIATAAVGVVALGVGIGYGLDAMAKHDDAKKACPSLCTDQHGVDLWNQARSAGNISTVAFIVGAAGMVGGAVLWLTGNPARHDGNERSGMQIGLGPGSVSWKGAW